MAWLSIRDQVETWLTAAGTPFYPTINEEQEPDDDVWMTVIYGFSFIGDKTFCDGRVENGTFTVVHYGNPGLGWRPVLQQAEAVNTYLRGVVDPIGKLVITNFGFPIEFTTGDGVPWYGVEIIYQFSFFA